MMSYRWPLLRFLLLAPWAISTVTTVAIGRANDDVPTLEQPGLKESLEKAPTLPVESLGEPARGVNVWEHWMVPNPDGQSWDVLQVYFKEYYGPTWLYVFDLGSGQVHKQRLPDGFQFYLSGRALGFDGKYYIATPFRETWNMHMFVYDPETNQVEAQGEIVPGLGGEVRPLAVGPDGKIYGTGTRGNRLGLYVYDPKLQKVVKDYGPIGPPHPNGAWSRYTMAVDETHAYLVSGMIPAWYLLAVELATGKEEVLLESPSQLTTDIVEEFPGAWAIVPQPGDAPRKEYWLYGGKAIPKTGSPPWKPRPSPWDKGEQSKPQVYYEQIDPDPEGRATLWYRTREDAERARQWREQFPDRKASPEELGWKAIHASGVETYPHRINPMTILPDGRLYGTGEDYVGVFAFDPKTDTIEVLGPRPGHAPYTQIVHEGLLYSSGYAGGPLYVYDPKKPWTLAKGVPPGTRMPGSSDRDSNPRLLGSFWEKTRVSIAHRSAIGTDGRVYFGGFGLRNYTGGGLGWYDPKTETLDGFWKPLSGYAVHWITAARDGQWIVLSTVIAPDELNGNRAPPEAKLFVYDVREQKIIREIIPNPGAITTGLIVETRPGFIMGLTTEKRGATTSLLYGVELETGAIAFRKILPSAVSVDSAWPHWVDPSYEYEHLTMGPDGFVWAYLRDVLVRINPNTAEVHPVGRVTPVGYPTFVGRDVYLSGLETLRRIKNIVPEQ